MQENKHSFVFSQLGQRLGETLGLGSRDEEERCALNIGTLRYIWRLLYSDNSGLSLIQKTHNLIVIATIIKTQFKYQHHSPFSGRSQVAQTFSNNF